MPQTIKKQTTPLDVLKRLSVHHSLQAQCLDYPGSKSAETFFHMKLVCDNNPLSNVAISLSSGKYLAQKSTQVVLINHHGEQVSFGFHNHQIAYSLNTGEKQVYDCTPTENAQAYERVLHMLYLGDHSLFLDTHLPIEALRLITPFLEAKSNLPMGTYKLGSAISDLI